MTREWTIRIATLVLWLGGCPGLASSDDHGETTVPNGDDGATDTELDTDSDTDRTAVDTDLPVETFHTGTPPIDTTPIGSTAATADTAAPISSASTGDTGIDDCGSGDSDSDSGSGACGYGSADCGFNCPPGTYCAECLSTYCDCGSDSGLFCIRTSCMPCGEVC